MVVERAIEHIRFMHRRNINERHAFDYKTDAIGWEKYPIPVLGSMKKIRCLILM